MNVSQNTKSVVSLSDAAGVASSGTHSVAIDTIGYDLASIDVVYRSIANTAAPSVLAIAHSDTDGSYAAITGLVQGTDYTLSGVANTATPNVTRVELSTKALRRYLRVSVTPSASGTTNASNNTIAVVARLSKSESGVQTASGIGVTNRVVLG